MTPRAFAVAAVALFVSTAALAEPAELMDARRALASAVGSQDVSGAANLMHFPLRAGTGSLGEAQFLRDPLQFKRIFGDNGIASCLASEPAQEQGSPYFADAPWFIDCNGHGYYFGQFSGRFLMGGYADDD